LRRLERPTAPPDDATKIAEILAGLLKSRQGETLGVSPVFATVAAEYDIRQTVRLLDGILRTYID
jgi:hypothetical protein